MSDDKNEKVKKSGAPADGELELSDKKTTENQNEYTTFSNDFSLPWTLPGVGKKRPVECKVIVGMSGGLDSTVTAFLLKKQGYNVIGMAMEMMEAETKYNLINGCRINEMRKVQEIAEYLGIKFYAVNAMNYFSEKVIEPVLTSALSGVSHSPCHNCNRVKIDILVHKGVKLGVDAIATGHYAKIHHNHNTNHYVLHAANDLDYDQSHLLSTLTQSQLSTLILPLGELKRVEVLKLAKNYGLPYIKKEEATKRCFTYLPDRVEFIRSKVSKEITKDGNLLSSDDEGLLGEHEGIHNFYLGESDVARKLDYGSSQFDKRDKVVKIDPDSNTVFIGKKEELSGQYFSLKGAYFSSMTEKIKPLYAYVKFEKFDELLPAKIFFKAADVVNIELDEAVDEILRGEKVTVFNKKGSMGKVLFTGEVNYIGTLKNLSRIESAEEPEMDDDGNPIPLYGPDFQF